MGGILVGCYVPVERNVCVFVEDVGPSNGKPILFIHGWPANNKMFEYQFNELPGLGYRCIGVDLRGFGKSDRPWDGYAYDRLADDIRIVIDALQLEGVTLAGMSVGGAIAIRYMARHAEHKIAKLALIGAAAPVFTKRPDFPYGLAKEEVDTLIETACKDRPKMLANFGEMFFARHISEKFSNWFFHLGLEASGHGTIKLAISLRDEDLRPDLSKIHVPTAIFHGLLDRVCPFPLAEAMHAGIKGSTLIPFIYGGHGLFYCELERFNYELARFIG